MPPRWADYSVRDWARLRPLVQAQKIMRYRMVDRLYSRLSPRDGSLESLGARLRSRRIAVSVAFEDPQTVEWQAKLVALYLPDDIVYVVADNSRDDEKARSIRETAGHLGVAYLRLPENPWRGASRQHGIALNWIWRNVVRPSAPAAFGLLDDDIFPTAPNDPFAVLQRQPFFGVVRTAELSDARPRPPAADRPWFLWAGFAFFRFADVVDKGLDFGQDWFSGMDTGGANWQPLYRHHRLSETVVQPTRYFSYKDGVATQDAPLQWCGEWLHEIGLMGRPDMKDDKRRAVQAMLAPHLLRAEERMRNMSAKT